MKKIGVVNDLHLEASNMEIHNPGWDYLVISGDLSADFNAMRHFFSYHAPQDIPIIYVLGNHEYEGKNLEETPEKLKNLLKPFSNVHLLDNESIVIDNIKFIGSTLWSNFELEGIYQKEEAMKWAKQNIIDFTYISYKNEEGKKVPLTPEKMVQLNEKAVRFLEFELKNNPFDGEKVVVTHFAPHPNSVHNSHRNKMSSYWVNNLEHLMGFSEYWLHGHTHNNFDYIIEGTRVVCNPRGYSKLLNISSNSEFNPKLSVLTQEPTVHQKLKIK